MGNQMGYNSAVTALIVIDLQNDFFKDPRLRRKEKRLVDNVNLVVKWARENTFPIIWVRQEFKPDLTDAPLYNQKNNIQNVISGTFGAQLLPQLDYKPTDIIIIKKRYSAFFQTNLDEVIKKLKIEKLIICGVNTQSCVRTTAIDAYQRDLEVILALDAVASYDQVQHQNSLKYLQYAIAKGEKCTTLTSTP